MLTTVLTGVGTMIPAKTPSSDRRFRSEPADGKGANYLAIWLAGLAAAAALLAAPARSQEVVADPEPVIERADGEPVVIDESKVEQSDDAGESARAAPVVDPPGRVARVGYVDGEITVAPAGTDEWADAALNRPLTSGDRLWVEKGGRAELQIGSAAVYLDGDTGFGFIELDDGVLQASLTEGAATIRVRRLAEGETLQVETPHSTVLLNRVGEYHLEVDKAGDRTIVKTRSGEAEVKGGEQRFTVRDNERGIFAGVDNLTGRIEQLDARTAFENWANDRDARNERSKSAQYVSRDVIGYEDLDDNGEWISEPEYGHVWRPTVVAYDWAPYRYGRWAYVSPWGWSWIDDARWGFAPSHYGRWAHIRDRWCWVPGPRHIRPVYAPALVGWVGGPSVGVSVSFGSGVGWYPLGPRDVFYPGYRHTPRYIRYVNVSNTVIVNNNYYYGGRRQPWPRFDPRKYPHAVTAVSRDNFVGGRSINGRWMRVNDSDLRAWRDERRPPAIAPYRESVLAGPVRNAPRDSDRFRGNRQGDFFAGRVPFHAERSAIESNGGRPIARNELQGRARSDGNPKNGADFRSVQRGFSGGNSNANGNNQPRAARELNNDSVREWQARRERDGDRDRNRGSNTVTDTVTAPRYDSGSNSLSPRTSQDRNNERLEVMRADEARRNAREDARRREQTRQPGNSFQQGSNGFYRPPSAPQPDRSREREPRGASGITRSEPPRSYNPPAKESRRDYTPAPRQEPRSQPQQSQPRQQNFERAQPRSNNGGGGGNGNPKNGSRPLSGSRER